MEFKGVHFTEWYTCRKLDAYLPGSGPVLPVLSLHTRGLGWSLNA